MLNLTQAKLLRDIDEIVEQMSSLARSFNDVGLRNSYMRNRDCKKYLPLLNKVVGHSIENDLELYNQACRFLFEEFAHSVNEDNHELRRGALLPEIWNKRRRYQESMLRPLDKLSKADEFARVTYQQFREEPIDCLILTALPKEFMAVARRFTYYLDGSHPKMTKGFPEPGFDDNNDSREDGWVRGVIEDEDGRKAVVVVVCQKQYGPSHAANVIRKFMTSAHFSLRPHHVLVVGIAGNLDDGTQLRLGDIGVSKVIKSIDTAKLIRATTTLTLDEQVTVDNLPEHIRQFASFDVDKKIFNYLGIADVDDVEYFKSVCSSEEDKRKMEMLPERTRATAGPVEVNPKPVLCPESLINAAEKVKEQERWQRRIQLPSPNGRLPALLRVEPTEVVSSPFLVKQTAARKYIKEMCPDALIIEMEGGGASIPLPDDNKPVVIKSACDWANEGKNNEWQLYCADVAAAFAVELALEINTPLDMSATN